ncbi:hypothetical protein D0869_03147 [Hortaea werneckii]|nr:hypothetical protein KC324_g3434 [Hortaea werneckii]KAI7590285.1 hypothetical protein KC316_g3466 [Hortaea werneckii]RMX86351.1 hypothetical protein D0869_03147 [Hortaea werneckii]
MVSSATWKESFPPRTKPMKQPRPLLANEYPNCLYSDVLEKGCSQNPWGCTGYERGEAQRRLGSDGEVRFAFDEENDGIGFVVVLRQELDVQPQRREDPVPGPLPTWSPLPQIPSYAQNADPSDHEAESAPWWQPQPWTDQPWDMDYDSTNPFYSKEAIAKRERQRELLGLNRHTSSPPASSSPNLEDVVPEREVSLVPLGLPASAHLDPERDAPGPVLSNHLGYAHMPSIQRFGSTRTEGARNSSKPRKPRSDRGVPRKGRLGKRGRKTA